MESSKFSGFTEILDDYTTEGTLYTQLKDSNVQCYACAHRCLIRPNRRGICKLRFNKNGVLRVPWGYVVSAQVDPIEKKPFSHFLPGSDVLTFGMFGCNFHCSFCQNWVTSQTLRDPQAAMGVRYIQEVTPAELVKYARNSGAEIVASSYNEPLITTEWAAAIFKEAKQADLRCAYVSNGYATPETLEYLRPFLDAFKVDLKSFQPENYRRMGGTLDRVKETIQTAYDMGMWVEVVTLVIPGFNDSPEELWEISRFLVSVSPDIPWHVSAFHPDYKIQNKSRTSAQTLQTAAEIGQEAGLRHVYAGNLPGRVGSLENTYCPVCSTALVKRQGYFISEYKLTSQGTCPKCKNQVAGIWTDNPANVRLDNWGFPRRLKI